MNLKQKIEEWEKTKKEISPWPWIEYKPDDYHGRGISDKNGAKIPNHDTDIPFIVSAPKNYDAAMQALKEAAKIIKVQSDFTGKDEYNPNGDWLKKWGFEE